MGYAVATVLGLPLQSLRNWKVGCGRFTPFFIKMPEPEHVETAKAELDRLSTEAD
jgi:hypothetical protein